MNRRTFLNAALKLSILSGVSSILEACNAPVSPPFQPSVRPGVAPQGRPNSMATPTPAPTSAPVAVDADDLGRVAFVKTQDRAAGVRQALALLGRNPVAGKTVLVKPNFNSADPAPGSTHPLVLRTLIQQLQEWGARSITVADRSGMGDTRRVMEQLGVFDLSRELGFDVLVLDELDAGGWELIQPPGSHWQRGFAIARCCRDAEVVVQTCCLKTHRFGGHFTLSLKNSVGLAAKYVPGDPYNYMQELHSSPHQRRMIAEINAAYTPQLVILDGVEAFVDGGPDRGKKVQAEVVLAGVDRVAIDAVGVALLRYFGTTPAVSRGRIFEQEQIARAVELGLGVADPGQVHFLTADPDSRAYATQIQQILQEG